jgi:hypothetical protein
MVIIDCKVELRARRGVPVVRLRKRIIQFTEDFSVFINSNHVPVAVGCRPALNRRGKRNGKRSWIALVAVIGVHDWHQGLCRRHDKIRDADRSAVIHRAEIRVELGGRSHRSKVIGRIGMHLVIRDVPLPYIVIGENLKIAQVLVRPGIKRSWRGH